MGQWEEGKEEKTEEGIKQENTHFRLIHFVE